MPATKSFAISHKNISSSSYRSKNIVTLAVYAHLSYLLIACSDLPSLDKNLKQQAESLDAAQQKLEKFGTVTVSAPIFVDADDGAFTFDLKRTGTKYFEEAKSDVQGGAATSEQQVQSFALSVALAQDPTLTKKYDELLKQYDRQESRKRAQEEVSDQAARDIMSAAREEYLLATKAALAETDLDKRASMIAAANTRYSDSLKLVSAATVPDFPTATSVGTPSAPNIDPKKGTAADTFGKAFTPAFQLLDNISPASSRKISNRAAIITAAGDNTVESIFRILGNPGLNKAFSNKKIFFGVAMVSVIPGRETQKNFAADVSVQVNMELHSASPGASAEYINKWSDKLGIALKGSLGQKMGVNPTNVNDASTRSSIQYTQQIYSKREPLSAEEENAIRNKKTQSETEFSALPLDLIGGDLSARDKFEPTGSYKDCKSYDEIKNSGETETFAVTQKFSPTVSAVAPMTESQILDLASSSRNQQQLAISLAYTLQSAGQSAQASAFEDYAKRLESDAITRTPQNLVTGYSRGNIFGYQVGPSFQALQGKYEDGKPGSVLQRQSFPVLVIFGVDSSMSSPRIYKSRCGGAYVLMEPYIALTQQDSWTPIASKWYLPTKRESLVERAQVAMAIHDVSVFDPCQNAVSAYESCKNEHSGNYIPICDSLWRTQSGCYAAKDYLGTKSRQLDNLLNTPKLLFSFPENKTDTTSKIKNVFPGAIAAVAKGEIAAFLFSGTELNNVDLKSVGLLVPADAAQLVDPDVAEPNESTPSAAKLIDGSLLVKIKAKRDIAGEALVFKFSTKPPSINSAPVEIVSLPITVSPKAAEKSKNSKTAASAGTAEKQASTTVVVTTKTSKDGLEKSVSIAKEASTSAIQGAVEVLRAESEKNKPTILVKQKIPTTTAGEPGK